MDRLDDRYSWLAKSAGFTSVGDLMNGINADMRLTAFQKRQLLDIARESGVPVTQSASKIPGLFAGGALGNVVSGMLGANGFWRGAATLAGASVANSVMNMRRDPHRVQGGYRLV